MPELTLTEVARRLDVSPATLRRWVAEGIVPLQRRRWTPAAVAQARIVARLRERGHSLDAAARGRPQRPARVRLPGGAVPGRRPRRYSAQGGRQGDRLEPALIRRIWRPPGSPPTTLERALRGRRRAAARHRPRCSTPGFPLVAFLQLVRVYGQALAQIADAEVKLFHLYVHEPLIRDGRRRARDRRGDGGPGLRAAPAGRADHGPRPPALLQHFIEQDVVGHLEIEVDSDDRARARCGSRSPSPTSRATPA